MKKASKDEYKLPCPNDDLKTYYEKIILKCWNKNSLLRPTFQELDEILFTYFDYCEPDYKFKAKNATRLSLSEFDEIKEQNPDQINLGVLVKSRSNTEIWIGRKIKANLFVCKFFAY